MKKSVCPSVTPKLIAMALTSMVGFAMVAPSQAMGQTTSNSGQRDLVMWYGTQRRQSTNQQVQTGSNNRTASQRGVPGYFQDPAARQSANRGAIRPATNYPTAVNGEQTNQREQEQQAERQRAQQNSRKQDPMAAPVLSPAAQRFFQELRGPNLSTWNQNRSNYSFFGQTRPSTTIPGTTWQSGSRFGQTYSHRSTHNQTTFNQNRFNFSLQNITAPGLRGYR